MLLLILEQPSARMTIQEFREFSLPEEQAQEALLHRALSKRILFPLIKKTKIKPMPANPATTPRNPRIFTMQGYLFTKESISLIPSFVLYMKSNLPAQQTCPGASDKTNKAMHKRILKTKDRSSFTSAFHSSSCGLFRLLS